MQKDLNKKDNIKVVKDFDDLLEKMKQFCRQSMEQNKPTCFSYRDLKRKLEDLSSVVGYMAFFESYGFIQGFVAALAGSNFITEEEETNLENELTDLKNYAFKKCTSLSI